MSTTPYENRHAKITKTVRKIGVNKHVIKTLAFRDQQMTALNLKNGIDTKFFQGKKQNLSNEKKRKHNNFLTDKTVELAWIKYGYKYEKGFFLFLKEKILYEIDLIFMEDEDIFLLLCPFETEINDFHVSLKLIKRLDTFEVFKFDDIKRFKPFEKVLSRKDNSYYVQVS